MRKVRRSVNALLTAAGTLLVLYAVFEIASVYERALTVALGLILIEAGIWQLTRSLLPNERKYTALRKETDYFVDLVRRLNRAAVKVSEGAEDMESELARVHDEMHHSVDRLLRLAGQEDEEPAK
jgi:hypothetical protein